MSLSDEDSLTLSSLLGDDSDGELLSSDMSSSSLPSAPAKRLRTEEEDTKTSPTSAECAEQFQVQGIRYEPTTDQLWCALCTTGSRNMTEANADADERETLTTADGKGEDSLTESTSKPEAAMPPLEKVLCMVGRTQQDVLDHCATRDHLLRFEKTRLSDLQHWCPVQLHGERVLLDHHCVYPAQMFGPGRMIMDSTIGGGVLLAHDVCGGVKLWPRHRYDVVEMVLPQARSFVDRVTVEDVGSLARGDDLSQGADTKPPGKRAVDVFYEGASVWLEKEEVKRLVRSSQLRNMRTAGASCLPSFYRQLHGAWSKRMQANDFSKVLKETNNFIIGEAKFRQKRAERFAKENL